MAEEDDDNWYFDRFIGEIDDKINKKQKLSTPMILYSFLLGTSGTLAIFLGDSFINLTNTLNKLLKVNLIIPILINLLYDSLHVIFIKPWSLKFPHKNLSYLFHGYMTVFVPVKEVEGLLEFKTLLLFLTLQAKCDKLVAL